MGCRKDVNVIKELFNVQYKTSGRCAFCKYWYDPINSAIEPTEPKAGYWRYERNVRCKCIRTGLMKASYATCNYYECKILL